MHTVLLLAHVIIAVSLIALVLLQQGKGADAGAAFGSGASSTVFGSRGAASFLTRTTAALATGFFLTSLILAYFATRSSEPESVLDRVQLESPQQQESAPATSEPEQKGPLDIPQVPQSPSQ